jgi:GAF domain-containing protein
LPPSEHFYQRMLASNTRDARALVETMLKTRSRTEVYDSVIVPALTMIEEAKHSEEMTAARAEEVLQSTEDLIEELYIEVGFAAQHRSKSGKSIICIPARDFADEIACELAQQVLEDIASVRIVSADASLASLQQWMARKQAEVICVVGVPPGAVRYTKMRCHQIRTRFPESVVLACILGDEKDLSSLRSRIPSEDAQHVASSLQLMSDYLRSVLRPVSTEPGWTQETENAAETGRVLTGEIQEIQQPDPFDGPAEGMFDRLATNLARSFDAPIALITATDGELQFWEAQCGLPENFLSANGAMRDCSICMRLAESGALSVVADTAEDERFADDAFLKDHGIRFCAVAPLKDHDENVVGSLCVLDTRPRQITEKQKETLVSAAESVMTAIEMSDAVAARDLAAHKEVSSH